MLRNIGLAGAVRALVLFLSIVLLMLSSVFGMLSNFLFVFLMISAAVIALSVLVGLYRKQVYRSISVIESKRAYLLRGLVRCVSWLVIGLSVHIALIPIQFSSAELFEVRITLWGCVILLCCLSWVPFKRVSNSLTITLCVFFCFLVYQLFMSYTPQPTETVVELRSALDADWYVMQGGNSALLNHHHFAGSQKYALDLIVPEDGVLPSKQDVGLKQYASFGSVLHSPVEGVVVAVEHSLSDQKIGETDTENLAGNHIVIQIDSDLFLLLAHLQQNSVQVSEGSRVNIGQKIARIGNSGNTSQPHLHVHAMSKADFMSADSRPIPVSIAAEDGSLKFYKRNDYLSGTAN